VDQLLKDGTYASGADLAVAYGALARGCGIPTVWVKTVDRDWIAEFRRGTTGPDPRRAHVFLEVHDGTRWRLLEPERGILFDDHDRGTRLYPGDRWAYDRGGDPQALLLPTHGPAWAEQARRHFASLDLHQVPWSRARDLQAPFTLHVVLPADRSDAWAGWVREVAAALRYETGNLAAGDPTPWLPRARGGTVVVLAPAGQPALPPALARDLLPDGSAAFLAARGDGKPDWLERRHPDGTRVLLVRAEDQPRLQKALVEALR
jgi:hypothetical protein